MAEKLQGTIKTVTANQYGTSLTLNEFQGYFNVSQFYQGPELHDGLKGQRVEIAYAPGKQEGRYYLNGLVLLDGQAPAPALPQPTAPAPSSAPQPAPSYQGYYRAEGPMGLLGKYGDTAAAPPVDKDHLIVRQSSLKAAVEWGLAHPDQYQTELSIVILAEYWERWVFGAAGEQQPGEQVADDPGFAPDVP